MASTVNKATLLGNVGKDPEIRITQAEMKIANFSIATQKKVRDEVTTQWHNCVAFGKLAEIIELYVFKGSKIYLEGTIDYSQYQSEGVTKYVTKIIASEISLLSSKADSVTAKPAEFIPSPVNDDDSPDIPF